MDYLQYPLTILPDTTLVILSQAFSEPSTGAPKRTTSSTTPSLPRESQCKYNFQFMDVKKKKSLKLKAIIMFKSLLFRATVKF